jgi:hypothetical protein
VDRSANVSAVDWATTSVKLSARANMIRWFGGDEGHDSWALPVVAQERCHFPAR